MNLSAILFKGEGDGLHLLVADYLELNYGLTRKATR